MNICVLHHVEEMWENCFDKDNFIISIQKHFEHNSYDLVILTTLEYSNGYCELQHLWQQKEEWLYGWENPEIESEWYKDCGIDISKIIQTSGHNFSYIYPWIEKLKDATWHLMGGSRWECLQDLIDTLEYLDTKYKLINECIYGH